MNNKTIRELSTTFNISKEAIYKKINYSLKDELKDFVIKQDKKTYITPEGQSIILQSLKKEIQDTYNEINNHEDNKKYESSNSNTKLNYHTDNELLESLHNQIKNLTQQVNNHISEKKELLELNKSLVDTLNIKTKVDASRLINNRNNFNEPIKTSFFKKIFKF